MAEEKIYMWAGKMVDDMSAEEARAALKAACRLIEVAHEAQQRVFRTWEACREVRANG